MTTTLERAKARALSRVNADPEQAAKVAAKKAEIDGRLTEIYVLLTPLNTVTVNCEGGRGRVHVAHCPDWVDVRVSLLELNTQTMRWKDTGKLATFLRVWFENGLYNAAWQGSATKQAAQKEDCANWVADQIGDRLIPEGL